MRMVGLAQAKAELSALLDAVEAGDEVVITRRGTAVARLVREQPSGPASTQAWCERLRRLHEGQPVHPTTAVELVRELRDQE
ncbi:MAG: type II toxin-antitoxin system prevent-host-death family antitoxin [Prochlorococcaceae cyanobacterium]